MRITIKVGMISAFVWMAFKYGMFLFVPDNYELPFPILLNTFLLLVSICVGLYLHKKKEGYTQGNALSDIKGAMTSGVIYAVFVSGFIYFYYSKINPEFNRHQIAEAKAAIQSQLEDPKELKKIRYSQESFEVMSKEQIYTELIKGPSGFYAAGSTFILSLLSLVMLSMAYSILVTIVFRRVMFRDLYRNRSIEEKTE